MDTLNFLAPASMVMLNGMTISRAGKMRSNSPAGCFSPRQQASIQVQAMNVIGLVEYESVINVTCDVCGASTRLDEDEYQYGAAGTLGIWHQT
ncbi:hypothetical protein ACIPO9_23670 [Pseudomonas sp. NPDC090203]|uniref:hypothetical protein n=1 Tax=Pseudomonas sp. NPDC090203 TaxID=3364477 RepID=UPI00382788A7